VSEDPFFLKRPIRVEIKIPSTTHAPYLDNFSEHKGEAEILLPRGSKFKILGASVEPELYEGKTMSILVIKATLVQ